MRCASGVFSNFCSPGIFEIDDVVLRFLAYYLLICYFISSLLIKDISFKLWLYFKSKISKLFNGRSRGLKDFTTVIFLVFLLISSTLPQYIVYDHRSSRPEVFCKKRVLRNFAKFTGKHLCERLFFNKSLWHRCFPMNFAKLLRTLFFTEHRRWLLLWS